MDIIDFKTQIKRSIKVKKPYGGYGRGASNYSILWKIHSPPTLPQRDIYKQPMDIYLIKIFL